jgi:hypothetical protein
MTRLPSLTMCVQCAVAESATRALLTRACAVAAAARFLPGGHDC